MSESISKHIKSLIAEQVGKNISEIQDDAKFIEDLGADSLDIVELMMNIEEAFSIDIPDDDAQKILTVKDAISYVEKVEKLKK